MDEGSWVGQFAPTLLAAWHVRTVASLHSQADHLLRAHHHRHRNLRRRPGSQRTLLRAFLLPSPHLQRVTDRSEQHQLFPRRRCGTAGRHYEIARAESPTAALSEMRGTAAASTHSAIHLDNTRREGPSGPDPQESGLAFAHDQSHSRSTLSF